MANAQAQDIFPDRHRGVGLEEPHHVAGIQTDGIGDLLRREICKVVRVDVAGDGFPARLSAGDGPGRATPGVARQA